MKFPFVGPAYQSRSPAVNAQRCVNFYPEVDESGKNVLALYGTPGLRLLATCGGGPVRGMIAIGHLLYVVSGGYLYEVNKANAVTTLGTIAGTDRVSMSANRTQILIATGGTASVLSLVTGQVTTVTASGFPAAATHAAFLDSYSIVNNAGTDQFQISSSDDATTWDATDFASAEGNPDDIVALLTDHREVWLFGSKTIEVWYNSGNADFPIERLQGGYLEQGCAAPWSVAKAANTVFWLGIDTTGRGIVYQAQGYQPQRISTHAIEYQISTYSVISDAYGFTTQQDGHTFYWLTFPTADKTWVCDLSNGLWHERAYLNPSTGLQERHLASAHAVWNNMQIVGDRRNGRVYELDPDTYTDNSDPIRSVRACAAIWDKEDLRNAAHHRLEIDFEGGVGLTTGQGSDPQAMLRWSDSDGKQWSNEHWTGIGKIGEYRKRAIWRRLGASRERIYEVSISDPVKRAIVNAHLRASGGRS